MLWIIFVIALIGAVLNIRRNRWCFVCWFISNGTWLIRNAYAVEWAQAACYGIFFTVSIWGWFAWTDKGTKSGVDFARQNIKELQHGVNDDDE